MSAGCSRNALGACAGGMGNWAISSHYWAVSWTYRGVGGQERALGHGAIKVHVQCSNCCPSFNLICPFYFGFGAVLGQKMLFRGTKCAVLRGHHPTWRPCPGAPPVSFWLKTWIWQGHHLGYRMARVEQSPKRWNGVIAKTERRSASLLVACLLVACLLLARFKGRGV